MLEIDLATILLSRQPIIDIFFFQAEDGIRDGTVTGVQTCALPIYQPAQAQVEAAFQLLAFAMTFEAMRLEDRADVLLERRRSGGDDRRGIEEQPADRYGHRVRVHFGCP